MLAEVQATLAPAAAPELQPASDELVVLSFPIRDYAKTVEGSRFADNSDYEQLDDATALALVGNFSFTQNSSLFELLARRYFARGDRRPGFFTLLLSRWHRWNQEMDFGGKKYSFDPLKDTANKPLARYIKYCLESGFAQSESYDNAKGEGPLLTKLIAFHNVTTQSEQALWISPDETKRQSAQNRALKFASDKSTAPWMAWQVAMELCRVGEIDHQRLVTVLERFVDVPRLAYYARYERARQLNRHQDDGWREFDKWYRQCLAAGLLPSVDGEFHSAFVNRNQEEKLEALLRDAYQSLYERYGPLVAAPLAWQCRQLGRSDLGIEVIGKSLSKVNDQNQMTVTLSAVAYLDAVGHDQQASNLVDDLLSLPRYRDWSNLWRLAGKLANKQGYFARAARAEEQAVDLEFAASGDVVNLEQFRAQTTQLFEQYEQVAKAIAALDEGPSQAFVDRVVRAADRWRSLDTDSTQACQAAADVLQLAGATEVAWDYLTTPLADRPNESAPWLSLAQTLRDDGQVELAHRAYAQAHSMEATNADILWEHARFLESQGRLTAARKIYQQIADGDWQPRFQGIRQEAAEILAY